MRRFTALGLIASFLAVSGLPLLPEALACTHAAKRMEHASTGAVQHHHGSKRLPAADDCRIECGCGCHASSNGLPNLLSPHIAIVTDDKLVELSFAVEEAVFPTGEPVLHIVPTPPPKSFSLKHA